MSVRSYQVSWGGKVSGPASSPLVSHRGPYQIQDPGTDLPSGEQDCTATTTSLSCSLTPPPTVFFWLLKLSLKTATFWWSHRSTVPGPNTSSSPVPMVESTPHLNQRDWLPPHLQESTPPTPPQHSHCITFTSFPRGIHSPLVGACARKSLASSFPGSAGMQSSGLSSSSYRQRVSCELRGDARSLLPQYSAKNTNATRWSTVVNSRKRGTLERYFIWNAYHLSGAGFKPEVSYIV